MARRYIPRPLRPDSKCQSCGESIPAPRTGQMPKWCNKCKINRENVRASKRVTFRRCYKCQVEVSGFDGKPGRAVCDNCRVETRVRGREHEQRRRLRKYGLTQTEYDQMLSNQNGRCAGCFTDDPGVKGWCIDHCHRSGKVRALMCNRCNTVLGLTGESPNTLRNLADFIEREIKI